jgi:hypothetical protein
MTSPADSGDIRLRPLFDGLYVRLGMGGGKTGLFLIDTGSYRSFATLKGFSVLRNAGAKLERDGTLTSGSASLSGYPVGRINFAPWGNKQDAMHPLSDGIIGMDVLGGYRMGFDVRTRTMRLWSREVDISEAPLTWLAETAGGKPGALSADDISEIKLNPWEKYAPHVIVRIDGKPVSMCADTGAVETYVSARNATAFGWSKKWSGGGKTSFFNGAAKLKYYDIHDFRIGDVGFRGRHRVLVPQDDRDFNLIGCDVFLGLTTVFDFPVGKMYVAFSSRNDQEKSDKGSR